MKSLNRPLARHALAAALLLCGTLPLPAAPAEAQYLPAGRTSGASGGALRTPSTPGLTRGSYVVVVDLDANRLYFTRNRRVLWSAVVGTGTGLRLEHEKGEWDFSTPNGTFQVQHKAEEPVWIAPDWYFIENKLPIPPQDSPKRRFPGGLGSAAVYIGAGLAIHGTDKPELLGQRVSHGCIRLSNRDALRLFHNVQVGTEVVIVGGENAPPAAAPPAPARKTATTEQKKPTRDPYLVMLEGLSTPDLLAALDEEMGLTSGSRWPEVAGAVVRRVVKEDDGEALRGLFVRSQGLQGRTGQEFATFVADAYARAPRTTLRELGELTRAERTRLARLIVDATLALYPGDPEERLAPWPTRRIPRTALDSDAERGWDTLAAAEEWHRNGRGASTARAGR